MALACKFWDFEWYRKNYKEMLVALCAGAAPLPAVMETDGHYFAWREQLRALGDRATPPMCHSLLWNKIEVSGMPSQ